MIIPCISTAGRSRTECFSLSVFSGARWQFSARVSADLYFAVFSSRCENAFCNALCMHLCVCLSGRSGCSGSRRRQNRDKLWSPTWIKKLNFQGPSFLECPDDLQTLALQFLGAPQEMLLDCFVDAWRLHLRRPLEKKARTRTGRRADTGEDSSREAMTQTGLEDLLEEALRFFFETFFAEVF